MKKSENGFTLVELLVSIIIAAILVLTIGILSDIASRSFAKINNKQSIYTDISYGFKLLQNRVRVSSALSITAASGSWVSPQVTVNGGNFGIYRDTTNTPATREFSYDDGATREIILSVPDPADSSTVLDMTATQSSDAVTVTVTGIKNSIPFNVQTTVVRRNT